MNQSLKIELHRIEVEVMLRYMTSTIDHIKSGKNKNIADYFAIQKIGKKLHRGFQFSDTKSKKVKFERIEAKWLFDYLSKVAYLDTNIVNIFVELGKYVV